MLLRSRLSAVVLAIGLSASAYAVPKRTILNADAKGPARYIVALERDLPDVEALSNELARTNRGQLRAVHRFLHAFTVEMPASDALQLAQDPRVRYVEQDSATSINTTQSSPPWGLDRIDQRDRPVDSAYSYNVTGAGVTAYIVDTGINTSHTDFGGRASVGADFVADGHNGIDCNGHGTHVAGTVGGATYGVAKGVSLVAVRVLDCNGSGFVSNLVSGMNWVVGNHTTGLAVLNASVGADSASQSLNDAVAAVVTDGVVACVSAGNGTGNDGVPIDACNTSPGGVTSAITVSASDSGDVRGSFANFGPCVDIFAPGVSIISDWYSSNSATNTISGTSMAAPHVTGAAALYLQANPSATPASTAAALIASASLNKLTSIGTGSLNRLLYTADIGAANSCGITGVTTTTVSSSSVAGMTPQAPGLPRGGVWQKTQRPGGETWTYTFSVGDGPAITSPRQPISVPVSGEASSGARDTIGINGLPVTGDVLQQRRLTTADLPSIPRLDDAGASVNTNGATSGARGVTPRVARLAAPVALATAGSDGRGLSAFDAGFTGVAADDVASTVRVVLKLQHPNPAAVTIWLAAGDRDVVLFDGTHAEIDSSGSITIDRSLTQELSGRSLRDRWTLYVSDTTDGAAAGVLEQAVVAVTARPARAKAADIGANVSYDVAAQVAYMMTGAGLSGSEVDPPSIGQVVYLYLDFQISGTDPAQTITQRAMMDGSQYCAGSTLQSAGLYYVYCNASWTATAGSHTLQWDLDYNNTVVENNESNNSASKTFTPSAAGATDILAQRSYLMTGAGLSGSEVNPPTVGQTVYLYADYQVTAPSAIAVTQRATLDGSSYCSGSFTQGSGFYYVYCNAAWTATVGTHTLQWTLDYNNSIAETNENNNSASATFTPAAGVDIVAQRAYLRTAAAGGGIESDPPAAGQVVYFYTDYQVNTSSSVTVTQRALLDGSAYCTGSSPLSSGLYYAYCNSGWTATAGAHTLQWDLDYNNTLAETNEGNNSTSKVFTPTGGTPDIVAVRSYLRTGAAGGGAEIDPPAPGQIVYFHGAWQVTGSGGVINVTERAVLDNTTFCSCSSQATPGSSYVSSCSQPWTATAGTHTLRWDYDYNSAVPESNENNNSASKTVTVGTRAGDANADGSSDIFWRSYSTGANAVWLMNATTFTGTVLNLPALPNPQYRIEGVGDFNADGKPDVLWRNGTTGAVALWILNGASLTSTVNLPTLPGANFHFEGVADMDGDGDPDILIRNYTTGANAIWIMNGTVFSGTIVNLPTLPNPDYHIETAADFDGDGKPDIIWRNYTTGANALWIMNGTTYTGTTVNLPALPNPQYRIEAAGDFDKDGKNDIVWRSYGTGANAIWIMNGTTFSGTVVNLPTLPDVNYELSGPR
jgi:subtilisin family serine protease